VLDWHDEVVRGYRGADCHEHLVGSRLATATSRTSRISPPP